MHLFKKKVVSKALLCKVSHEKTEGRRIVDYLIIRNSTTGEKSKFDH